MMAKPQFIKIIFLVFFTLLAGCTQNTTQPDHDTSRHAAGAATGGAAAGLGFAALGAPRPLVVGAAAGGMALGYYVTTLRFDAGPIYKAGGEVYTQGDYIGIVIPSYKLFETNTDQLLPQAQPVLDSVVAVLKRYPESNILVTGNTGGNGPHRWNQKLSEARARKVASYLWANGVSSFRSQSLNTRRLRYVGYGDYFPIVNPMKITGVQKNSRVQITSYPSKKDLKLDNVSAAFDNMGSSEDLAPEHSL